MIYANEDMMLKWEARVQQLEIEGCTRSDAEGVADYEYKQWLIK